MPTTWTTEADSTASTWTTEADLTASTFITEADSTASTWITSTGGITSTFIFESSVTPPAYTLDFLNFVGTWESLDTIWSQVSGLWGSIYNG